LRRRGAIGCRRGDSEGDAEVKVLRLLTTPLSLPVTKKGPIAKPSSFTLKKVCLASPGVRRLPQNSVPSLMAMNLGVSVPANSGWIKHPFQVTRASQRQVPPDQWLTLAFGFKVNWQVEQPYDGYGSCCLPRASVQGRWNPRDSTETQSCSWVRQISANICHAQSSMTMPLSEERLCCGRQPRRRSESKADHLQPCCFGLNFGYIIRGLPHFGKTALPVPLQRPFNARLLKNSLKARRPPSAFGPL